MLKNSVSVYLGLSASELSTNLWNYPFASILLGNMASSACDSPNYWVKLITGGPVLNRLQIFSLENLVLKVLQLTVGCCLSTTLLLASDHPENLKNNVSLDNNSVYQQDTNNFIEKNHHFNKTGAPKWDFSSGLIWQLNIGQAKTSFFETDKGARLRGNHIEIRLQKFLTPLLLSGISQSYRNQQGILRKMNLTRAIDLEQFQLLGNLGIAWEANNDLGLRGGLMGGWSENRLSYQLQKDEKAYFSDSIENGQFTWGFEFGPTFKFMERWRVGLRWQKHNSITAVRFAEGNKATLHPLHTYLIWAEYIVETR